jgi:hypothetical protein
MRNIIKKVPGEHPFVTWIKKRIKRNLNFLCVLEGGPGIGKSYSGLEIAYELDPEFDPREQVAFNFKDLMRIINKFNNTNPEPTHEDLGAGSLDD